MESPPPVRDGGFWRGAETKGLKRKPPARCVPPKSVSMKSQAESKHRCGSMKAMVGVQRIYKSGRKPSNRAC